MVFEDFTITLFYRRPDAYKLELTVEVDVSKTNASIESVRPPVFAGGATVGGTPPFDAVQRARPTGSIPCSIMNLEALGRPPV